MAICSPVAISILFRSDLSYFPWVPCLGEVLRDRLTARRCRGMALDLSPPHVPLSAECSAYSGYTFEEGGTRVWNLRAKAMTEKSGSVRGHAVRCICNPRIFWGSVQASQARSAKGWQLSVIRASITCSASFSNAGVGDLSVLIALRTFATFR